MYKHNHNKPNIRFPITQQQIDTNSHSKHKHRASKSQSKENKHPNGISLSKQQKNTHRISLSKQQKTIHRTSLTKPVRTAGKYARMRKQLQQLRTEVKEMRVQVQHFKEMCIQSLPCSQVSAFRSSDNASHIKLQSVQTAKSQLLIQGASSMIQSQKVKGETMRAQQRQYYVEYYLAH